MRRRGCISVARLQMLGLLRHIPLLLVKLYALKVQKLVSF